MARQVRAWEQGALSGQHFLHRALTSRSGVCNLLLCVAFMEGSGQSCRDELHACPVAECWKAMRLGGADLGR